MARGRSPTYTEADLIADLQELADELGKTPTSKDMRELGAHSDYQYRAAFGTWNAAIDEAGLERNGTGGTCQYTEADLIEDLRRVADELGKSPSAPEMDRLGEASSDTYARRFDSWNGALAEAGLDSNTPSGILRRTDEFVDEVEQAARDYVAGGDDAWRNTTHFKAKHLADSLGASSQRIGQALAALRDAGVVEQVGAGSNCYTWRFTDQDQTEAQEREQGQAQGQVPADAD